MEILSQSILNNEPTIRLSIFLGLFVILAFSEWIKPRRPLVTNKGARWFTNWAIVILDSLVVRLLFPAAAVGVAFYAEENVYGLFNMAALPQPPHWFSILFCFFFMDFAIWFSHLASHKVPILWKVHRMHHSDRDLDVTTAIRFHPIEIVLSMLYKIVLVFLLGAPAISILLFEIALNGGALFNHSNWKLPLKLDRILRLFIVTPDMHRVHHSCEHNETDSNYGFNFPWWDRLFKTYIDQPRLGHDEMQIGLNEWQDEKPTQLNWSLLLPFKK
jgi:sterol desaturase/sphingolipid hydroxylase (fatty acid hydroxylase superfamily)